MSGIFAYTDYRKYLFDFYTEKKSRQSHFSHRYIAQKVGFQSSGYFSKILQGRVSISREMIIKLITFLQLRKREAEYFENLVLYNQAKNAREKKYYFEKLIKFQESKIKRVSKEQYRYFDKWYNLAIRELLNFYPFRGDYRELGNMLTPSVPAQDVKRTIELLEQLGLIVEQPDGGYQLTDKLITTGFEGNHIAINNYQLSALELVKQAVDNFPKDRRSLSTITLSCSEGVYKEIQERLTSFRREILELIKEDSESINGVYQFNAQLFPLSHLYRGDKK